MKNLLGGKGANLAEMCRLGLPVPGAIYEGESLFLRGADSNYVLPAYEAEMGRRFPASRVVTILDAGHWVHIDQAETFQCCVLEFLS